MGWRGGSGRGVTVHNAGERYADDRSRVFVNDYQARKSQSAIQPASRPTTQGRERRDVGGRAGRQLFNAIY